MAGKSTSGWRRTEPGTALDRLRSKSPQPHEVRRIGGGLAALAVCSFTGIQLGRNAPLGRSPAGIEFAHAVASPAALLVPAGVAIAIGAVADVELRVVGLVAAGVFSLLAAFGSIATVPAVGVLPIATLLVAAPTMSEAPGRTPWRPLFALLAVVAVTLSLSATAGVFGSGVQSVGTTAWLVALPVAAATANPSRGALFAGGVAACCVALGAVAAPFVAGAVLLAAGAAIDPHLAVAAAGVGGGVAIVAEGARQRRAPMTAAGLLLLAAGVPATVPRALGVVLGVYLLLMTTGPSDSRGPNGGDPA